MGLRRLATTIVETVLATRSQPKNHVPKPLEINADGVPLIGDHHRLVVPSGQWRYCRGVLPRSAATTRRAGRQGRATRNLSLCRSDPVDKWWTPQLRPEDLVEPTGQGVEELEAIGSALVGEPLRPISLALQEIVATGGNIFRCRYFHAGLLSGSLLLVAGLCQLYKVAPNLFMDIVLGYIFYKLSVLAADLKRDGKANTICARIQWVLVVILFHRCNNPTKDFYYHFTEFVWSFGFDVYTLTVFCECVGIKHPRHLLEALFKKILTTIGDLIDRA